MRFKSLFFLSLAAGMLMLASCADMKMTKDIYDDWWPIHAKGSQEANHFAASWDGDLDNYGAIRVTFNDTDNMGLSYSQYMYYKALSFAKDRKAFCYIDISDRDYPASRYLNFYIKDQKIYFEKLNEAGRGNGEYEEGKDIKFLDKDHMLIDGVTYERYAVYYENKVRSRVTSARPPIDGRIPVMIYE